MSGVPLEYASHETARKIGRRGLWVMAIALMLYVGSYLVLRECIEPAANLAYFVYPGSVTANECYYYGFWPLYKIDRLMTGRKHNLDRAPIVMPEGDSGL
jgi:hypothetical protein